VVFRFLLCFLGTNSGWTSLPNFQLQLVNQAAHVQGVERDLIRVQTNVETLEAQEKDAYTELSRHQHHMVAAIQNVSIWKDFSLAFVSVSSSSLTDLVHSYVILERLVPRLNEKNQEIFPVVKKIASIKKSVRDAKGYAKELTQAYDQAIEELTRLFDEKNRFSPVQNLDSKIIYNTPAELMATLQKLAPIVSVSPHASTHQETALLHPVVGTVLRSASSQTIQAVFKARANSLVISPWGGVVVYAGPMKENGHVVVVQQDTFYAVLCGLGSVYCGAGEKVLAGEPIGRMPSLMKMSVQKTEESEPCLTLQLFKNTTPLDPTPYLKGSV
jgi:septal ring factor EnvC (AmiA/AmiB activator)